jgi:hypothetical protein
MAMKKDKITDEVNSIRLAEFHNQGCRNMLQHGQ